MATALQIKELDEETKKALEEIIENNNSVKNRYTSAAVHAIKHHTKFANKIKQQKQEIAAKDNELEKLYSLINTFIQTKDDLYKMVQENTNKKIMDNLS